MRVPVNFFGAKPPPAWESGYRCEWGQVVGRRVRLLRQREGMRVKDLARELRRVDGKPYSMSFVSRLENGWASAPLFVYIRMAQLFEVTPGELLGPEPAERSLTDGEMTLVRVVRRLGVSPEDVLAGLVASGPDQEIRPAARR